MSNLLNNKIIVGAVILLMVLGFLIVTNVKVKANGGAIQVSVSGTLLEVVSELEKVKKIIGLSGVEEEISLAAQSGPDVFSDVECHNGVCEQNERVGFTATSSVPIVFPLKLSATSSIERVSCNITGNGLGAITYDIATATAATRWDSGRRKRR